MVKKLPVEPELLCLCGNTSKNGWIPIRAKFLMGSFRVAPCADKLLSKLEIGYALALHAQGDWGNVSEDTWERNNHSVENGGRLLSRYCNHAGVIFFILTEADRSATSLFLPDDREGYLSDNIQTNGNGSTSEEK